MNWFPLKNLTHYSLLKAFSKPKELASLCAKFDYPACGICDYKSISGAVSFFQACKNVGIKPIIGCTFDNNTVFAKNKNGWLDLITLVSSMDDNGQIPNDIVQDINDRKNLIYVNEIGINNSFYTKPEHANLHRVLLCSELKTTLPKIQKQVRKGELSEDISDYFKSDNKHIVPQKVCKKLQEVYNTCEDYDILSKPILPKFECPNNLSEEEYLKTLARNGWRELLINTGKVKDSHNKDIYLKRFNLELEVIKNANLFGYFLIVQDIMNYVQKMGWMIGPGRGSAAGCLISYLIGITQIDPVEYDLLFERFYNAGRNSDDHISLPDIDMDVPAQKRDSVIQYLKEKYGHQHVSQMITFGRLQGRSAIKEVLRINEACSFAEMNAITKSVPNEAEISDQLAEMDDEDRSIIKWSLINRSKELQDFCYLDDNGALQGQYSEFFQQAIEIEGTFKTQGKHAAGVVISANPLNGVCPMVKPKHGTEKVAGLEMSDLEALGHVKFDVLGINLLDKLMKIKDITMNDTNKASETIYG